MDVMAQTLADFEAIKGEEEIEVCVRTKRGMCSENSERELVLQNKTACLRGKDC